jgi:hypothetical protein
MRISFCSTLLVIFAFGMAYGQDNDTSFSTGPQYLMNYGSPLFARPISTPSLSLSGPALDVGASNATEDLVAGADNRTTSPQVEPPSNLFPIFYGAPRASVIEISLPSEPSSNPLPPSILDAGVWQMTTVQALRQRGYGVTLAEAAAYGKAHVGNTTHTYTNADVDRLHKQ